MATTNANDSRPGDNRGNTGSSENHRPGNSRETGSNNKTAGQKDRGNSPFNRENKPYNKDSRYDTLNRGNKPYNKDSKPYGGTDSRDRKPSGNLNRNRDMKGSGYNKDYDSDDLYGKGYSRGKDQRLNDSRARTSQNREKEQQPDKLETIRRLEREKKAIQKKSQETDKKRDKHSRPQVKQRRTNNIDWTKGYANGRYGDDDEDYT